MLLVGGLGVRRELRRVLLAAPGGEAKGGDEEGEEGADEPDRFAEGEGIDLQEADDEEEEAGSEEPEADGGPVMNGVGLVGVAG